MEHRFREDENELPYLVSEKRGNGRRYEKTTRYDRVFRNITIDEFPKILNVLGFSPDQIRDLMNIIEIRPKNCICSIREDGTDDIIMKFNVKNEYVASKICVSYSRIRRRILGHGSLNNYDSLMSMQWFRDEVSRIENETGWKFSSCVGGFSFKISEYEFTLKDEFYFHASFEKDGEDDQREYSVDLQKRKFSNDYTVVPFYVFL